jgi:hypothetical protein
MTCGTKSTELMILVVSIKTLKKKNCNEYNVNGQWWYWNVNVCDTILLLIIHGLLMIFEESRWLIKMKK